MKRIYSALLLCCALCMPAFAEEFYIFPFLQNISPDGVTVIYQSTENGQGVIEYGLEGTFDQTAKGAENEMIRKVRITGLKPDTAYNYRVRVGEQERVRTFRTAPLPSADREVTFAVFGDTRRWDNRVEETKFIDHLMQWKPEFFLINGDLVVRGHEYNLWKPHFDRFDAIGGTHMLLTARGNHEGSMITDKENDWFGHYHDLPNGEPYSHFTWGNVHIVALAWEQTAVPAMISTTADWLDKHLAEVNSPYTFVAQHFPIYCTGYHGPNDNRKQPGQDMVYLSNVLDKHNVTGHMAGHTHIFERMYPVRDGKRDDRNGVHYIVNGGDINANYPELITAFSDNGSGYSKPTYTLYQCKKDRMDIRTFAWSEKTNQFEQIDRDISWKDEAVPKAVLASLDTLNGDERREAIEQLGAMLYAPAIPKLTEILNNSELADALACAWSISMIGAPESVTALQPYLDDENPALQYYAARACEVAMPAELANEIAKRARDDSQTPRVRVVLLGALQLHAPAEITKKTTLKILASDAPVEVRQRAAYALTRATTPKDIRKVLQALQKEEDVYVASRLAFTLNKLTGAPQNAEEVGKTKPEDRDRFLEHWRKAAKNKVAAAS